MYFYKSLGRKDVYFILTRMMEDTVRLDQLADEKVHNSELYHFKTRRSLPLSAKLKLSRQW